MLDEISGCKGGSSGKMFCKPGVLAEDCQPQETELGWEFANRLRSQSISPAGALGKISTEPFVWLLRGIHLCLFRIIGGARRANDAFPAVDIRTERAVYVAPPIFIMGSHEAEQHLVDARSSALIAHSLPPQYANKVEADFYIHMKLQLFSFTVVVDRAAFAPRPGGRL